MGAVAPGGVKVLNYDVIAALRLSDERVEQLVSKAAEKVAHQCELYDSGGRRRFPHGQFGRRRRRWLGDRGVDAGGADCGPGAAPRRLILAVPVAPPEPLALLAPLVDEEICSVRPAHMQAVGAWYEDFSQTTDAEVTGLLAEFSECRRD